jgi:hypothetical protein
MIEIATIKLTIKKEIIEAAELFLLGVVGIVPKGLLEGVIGPQTPVMYSEYISFFWHVGENS